MSRNTRVRQEFSSKSKDDACISRSIYKFFFSYNYLSCNIRFYVVFLLQGRCNREKPPCKYFHPPQHLKDQLLINGRNHLALKNALMQQMGISPGQPLVTGQVPAVVSTTLFLSLTLGMIAAQVFFQPFYVIKSFCVLTFFRLFGFFFTFILHVLFIACACGLAACCRCWCVSILIGFLCWRWTCLSTVSP